MPGEARHATVLICTYNRQALLARTLDTLAASGIDPSIRWDVLVVDNNSTDGTRAVVESRVAACPVPLRWLFEGKQGKAHALNTGIAACSSPIVLFTDDDVNVPAGWVEASVRPLLERDDIDYTGGPVLPDWEVPPPAWIHGDPRRLWGPLALVDYGAAPFIFEERQRIPLGVNMAVRRSLFERVGNFHPQLERSGASLIGQGQAEFFFRTRAAGARGLYVPEMVLRHHVPAARLMHSYYRRWWYWKGVARARMQEIHPVSEAGVDVRTTPHLGGVPRYLWGSAARHAGGWIRAAVTRDRVGRAEHEASLAYVAGFVRARLSGAPPPAELPGPAPAPLAASPGVPHATTRAAAPRGESETSLMR